MHRHTAGASLFGRNFAHVEPSLEMYAVAGVETYAQAIRHCVCINIYISMCIYIYIQDVILQVL